ncbi:amidase domain-containing protein [Paenibacillus methanolicus]|uniref:Putative amidase-like protein n=1 Tax=Paenibacillus methanolicus TaxID=582686 RepID=A0A5S5BWB1_9BACL|nr:amidase domain-containing protein [Paenibacillus methanolicus]TYP70598.1 putative amidase-like protein [Paenibacillus methanolicus]
MPRAGNRTKRTVKRPASPKPQASISSTDRRAAAAAIEPEGWKGALRQYVQLYNQAEIDRYAPAFETLLRDPDHLARYGSKLARLKEAELLRGAIPGKSETKVEIERVSESASGREVIVLLKLHISRAVEQLGRTYTEYRAERERIWLSREGGEYRITRIEPSLSERRPRYALRDPLSAAADAFFEEDVDGAAFATGSKPFINYDVLSGFKPSRGIRYRRDLAAEYADRWWNEANPAYENFEVNCTNYVSQCLFAGQAPMNYTGKRDSGWWYKGRAGGRESWSYSWAVSNALQIYLGATRRVGLRAEAVESASELALGDVIMYDWSGDGRFQHSTIVTAFDASGMPLVNANTVPSRHRYWDYKDSYAWTEQTRYRFFHIADEF